MLDDWQDDLSIMNKSISHLAPAKSAGRRASPEAEADESQQGARKAVANLRAARKGVSLGGLKGRDLSAERRR